MWLPDAMEGPTPVSALIHAATMVTAGVYLVVRCSIIFESSEGILYLVGLLGGLTSLFAASTGLFQNDLKKVIAYSTCSQLGYMFLACGLSGYDAAMFHLFTHAFFKALLFLGAGGVIHSVGDEQDLRRMGGLLRLLPLTYTAILIGSLSLMGMPFLSGFYSKEWILELAASRVYLYMLGVMSAFFTGFYSIRLIYLAFFSSARNNIIVYKKIHEVSTLMGMSYLVLIPSSIFVGYLFKDLLVGLGTNYWNYSIYVNYENQLGFEAEFLPYHIKLVPLFFALTGGITGYFFHKMTGEVYIFLIRKWYLDEMVNKLVSLVLSEGYKSMFKGLDRGIFEVYGPTGIAKWLGKSSEKVIKLQTGYLYHYIGWILFGLFTIVTIAFLGGAEGIVVVGISLLWLRLF
jgi:proton-translocating NADH-quinone oxidoreductase chain L